MQKKIVIVGEVDVLNNRIISILHKYSRYDADIFSPTLFLKDKIGYVFDHTSIILVDVDSTSLDIQTLISRIKSSDSNIRFIAMSGNTQKSKINEIVSLGFDEYILKPFTDLALIEKIYKFYESPRIDSNESLDLKSGGDTNRDYALNWSRDFEIGVLEIDEEHRGIIEAYENLYSHMKNGGGHEYYYEILDFLNQYVNTHFEHEEILQLKFNYDKRESHKELHLYFKQAVSSLIEAHRNKEVTNIDLIKLNLFIKDWLIHHILIEDKKLAQFIKEVQKQEAKSR